MLNKKFLDFIDAVFLKVKMERNTTKRILDYVNKGK
jgi:hypothetical protein